MGGKKEKETEKNFVLSWILTSRQPHRVTSERIAYSKFFYNNLSYALSYSYASELTEVNPNHPHKPEQKIEVSK